LRQLAILSSLASSPHLSQRQLAHTVHLSPSVVNAYLDRFLHQGLIEKWPLNARDFQYRLTPKGRARLSEMRVDYMRETFLLFSRGKEELANHLATLLGKHGFRRIALYSAGEVTELVIHSLLGLPIELVAIIDDDPKKQGQVMFGYPVVGPEACEELGVDAIIVTTFRYRQPIMEKVRHLKGEGIQVIGL
jgi:DNA-binding MarR family transcriptional regulator